jgi:hypothetical protein
VSKRQLRRRNELGNTFYKKNFRVGTKGERTSYRLREKQ